MTPPTTVASRYWLDGADDADDCDQNGETYHQNGETYYQGEEIYYQDTENPFFQDLLESGDDGRCTSAWTSRCLPCWKKMKH